MEARSHWGGVGVEYLMPLINLADVNWEESNVWLPHPPALSREGWNPGIPSVGGYSRPKARDRDKAILTYIC